MHSNNNNEEQYNRISKRPSNVSLVDLDIANTIPSEMKEDHSVTRKIQKTNMQRLDQQQFHATPGRLMKNAKSKITDLFLSAKSLGCPTKGS
jgi:hypothetical protein